MEDEHEGLVGTTVSRLPQRAIRRTRIAWFAIGVGFGMLGLWSVQLLAEVASQPSEPGLDFPLKGQEEHFSVVKSSPDAPAPEPSPSSSISLSSAASASPSSAPSSSPSAPPSQSPSKVPPPSSTPSVSPAAKKEDPSRPSPSSSPCHRAACETATSDGECAGICGCLWKHERNFCYTRYGASLLVGPEDPHPVPPVWRGTYEPDDLPQPLPPGFAGDPLPHAKGKRAYVTMISPMVPASTIDENRRYACMGLSLLTSIRHTNPDPSIDFVLVVLVSDDDHRFNGRKLSQELLPEILGVGFLDAYKKVGVNKFVIWTELDTSRTIANGNWKQAFSKLQMWTLVDYERIIFLDADKLVFRNMDHLFDVKGEFVTPGDWNCRNAGAALFPAGGFWVMSPSMKTYEVITNYLAGPDPCGEKWYQGDQILPRLLFTDTTEIVGPHNSLAPSVHGHDVARWDGDVAMMLGSDVNRRIGRCGSFVGYGSHPSHRVDAVVPLDRTKEPYIPPRSTWVMLNMSYDMTVGVCEDPAFINQDNRFEIGTGGWEKVNPFSVHMSCFDGKPACRVNSQLMQKAPPCLQEIFTKYYAFLAEYDMDRLLSNKPLQ